MYEMYSEI